MRAANIQNIMSEHYTQGRQGQGARHRRHYHSNRNYRHRMPRPEEPKPSLFKRVLSFFGFGGQKDQKKKSAKTDKDAKNQPTQRVRVAQPRTPRSGNPAAARKSRLRAVSTPPTENGRLYVGNLSFETTEPELEDLFKGFGRVRSVEIIYNSRTYRSKGYAFVEMEELADAKRAAEELHGQPFMGRELRVSAASEKTDRHDGEQSVEEREQTPDDDERAVSSVAFEEEVVVTIPDAQEAAPAKQVQA